MTGVSRPCHSIQLFQQRGHFILGLAKRRFPGDTPTLNPWCKELWVLAQREFHPASPPCPCQIHHHPSREQHTPIQAWPEPAETSCPRSKHGRVVSYFRTDLKEVWIEAIAISRSGFKILGMDLEGKSGIYRQVSRGQLLAVETECLWAPGLTCV